MAENCVVDYYNQIASQYDESRFGNSYGQFIDRQERWVLDNLKIDAATCLDLPCGTGRLSNYAAVGADASEAMLDEARKRFPDHRFLQADATQTGFSDASLQTILSFHFLMHLDADTVQKVMHEMHRLLLPDGRWICDIPSRQRRSLTSRQPEAWHGNTSMDVQQMRQLTQGLFEIQSVHGVMLMPVHRMPKSLRPSLCSLDFRAANLPLLRPLSSYLIFELKKI